MLLLMAFAGCSISESIGQCNNIGFEDGNFGGDWKGEWFDRYQGSGIGNPPKAPGPLNNDLNMHCIMSAGDKDPIIKGFSCVAPGSRHSVRLGNTRSGGHIAKLKRSFLVDSSNMVFTYRYAVILQDPTGDPTGHQGLNAPHFQVNMTDAGGAPISCAQYTVILGVTDVSNFTRVCSDASMGGAQTNAGCGALINPNDSATINEPPSASGSCNNGDLVYFRDWTTVSVTLDQYIGQTVTIEFVASDCGPNGHLGYAYVDADCTPLKINVPTLFCPLTDLTTTVHAPPGFKSYRWTSVSGGGMVSGTSDSVLVVNSKGTYEVELSSFSDRANCPPIELKYEVKEYCLPKPVNIEVCQNVRGQLKALVDLDAYRSQVTGSTPYTIQSWHSGNPATSANKITQTNRFEVDTSQTYYAKLSNQSADMVNVKFIIHPLPIITFDSIAPVCAGTTVPLAALPAGGVFTHNNQTITQFNDVAPGNNNIVTYRYTDLQGCTDSLVRTILIRPRPGITVAEVPQHCATVMQVNLFANFTNAQGVLWTGGSGSFSDAAAPVTTYRPSSAEKKDTLWLKIQTTGAAPCADTFVMVPVLFIPLPEAEAGGPYEICSGSSDAVLLKGALTNSPQGGVWTGGSGIFLPDRNTPEAKYFPSAEEKATGAEVMLTLKTISGKVCADVADSAVLSFNKTPSAELINGPLVLCETTVVVQLTGTLTNAAGGSWSGGQGDFIPGRSAINATYTPSSEEVELGKLVLRYTPVATGCPPAGDSVTLLYVKQPSVQAGTSLQVCANNMKVLLNGVATPSNIPVTWKSTGDGVFQPGNKILTTEYLPGSADITKGNVTLYLESGSAGTCVAARDSLIVTIDPAPVADAGNYPAQCAYDPVFRLSGKVSRATSFFWSGGKGNFTNSESLSTDYQFTYPEVQAGKVLVSLTAKAPGCKDVTDTVMLILKPQPAAVTGVYEKTCIGQTISIKAGPVENGSFIWSNKKGIIVGQEQNLVFTVLSDTTLVLLVNKAGCMDTAEVQLISVPPPILSVTDTSACKGQMVTLSVNVLNLDLLLHKGTVEYSWKGEGIEGRKDQSFMRTGKAGSYLVNVSAGSCLRSATAAVTIHDPPTSDLIRDNEIRFCPDDGKVITVQTNTTDQNFSYFWTFEDTLLLGPLYENISKGGWYRVKAVNEKGCESADSVWVKEICVPEVYVSNSFSPNKDNINERYLIFGRHFTNFRMLIFNRWGEIIYETKDREKPWDGFYLSGEMTTGVYPWIITYEGDSEEYKGPYKKEGSVTIIR